MTDSDAPMVSVRGLTRHYGESSVFADVDFDVAAGESVAVTGPSGVGKSTLLNCLAGLDRWDAGTIHIAGTALADLDETGLALWRRRQVGFVFQAFHVLPHLDVAQNIAVPLMLLGVPTRQRDERVDEMLVATGLTGLGQRLPQQLSGGQLQRVAIARALAHRPGLLLADEPTGNLDPDTARLVMDLLITEAAANRASLVLVTHSPSAASRANRRLQLSAHGVTDAG